MKIGLAKLKVQSLLPLFVMFLALLPSEKLFAAEYFKLQCDGVNNNANDVTLTLNAKIDVEGKLTTASFSNFKFYTNSLSKARGESSIQELNDFQASGSYDSKISDENENGIPDSILRFFEYSTTLGQTNYSLSATNRGQGGKSAFVLSVYSNSQIGQSGQTSAWTYCTLKRRWR